jgi:LysR family transcriptional activator of nhaA
MEWLNYHHLLYFWTIAREGSITRAGQVLHLAQPTLSTQVRTLEAALGERLFAKAGRNLELTDAGKMVYRYAEEIFSLGQEMLETLKDRPTGRQLRFSVGISDALSKLMIHRLLEPALALPEAIRLQCREDKTSRLLADLVTHQLDLVLTDSPMNPQTRIKAYNHVLGECNVGIYGAPDLIQKHKGKFPGRLNGAPLLLPSEGTSLRRSLEGWLKATGLKPVVAGEFDDSALMKSFGQAGIGFFAAPSVIRKEVERQYQVRQIGIAEGIKERIYAISIERKIKHPAVLAISQAARKSMPS